MKANYVTQNRYGNNQGQKNKREAKTNESFSPGTQHEQNTNNEERTESTLMPAHTSEILTDEQSNPLLGVTKNNMSEEAVCSGGIIKRR